MARTGLAQEGFESFPGDLPVGQCSATREVSQVQELHLFPLLGLTSVHPQAVPSSLVLLLLGLGSQDPSSFSCNPGLKSLPDPQGLAH